MKKMLFSVLAVLTFTSFAEVDVEKIIKWSNFTEDECIALDSYKGNSLGTNGFKIASEIDRAGKKDSRVFSDYVIYKSTFETIIKKYDKNLYHGYIFAQIPLNSINFSNGNVVISIFNEFKDVNASAGSNAFYVQNYYILKYNDFLKEKYSVNDFAEWFFNKNKKDYASQKMLVQFIQNNILQMEDTRTRLLLKKIKKVLYPNISDDNWKQLIVKVEIMIKSLE